ncbi:MAG: hypothetical protein JNL90_10320 [Planctomycetes bacterium]|nr:hypothetical protein [Planctomycetota bacterium]
MDETHDATPAADDAAPVRERGAPCLWFTRLPLRELLEEIRARHFAWLPGPLRVQFAEQERLAECDPGRPLLVSFHAVLNHAETPVELFGALAKRVIWPHAAAQRRGKRAMPLPFAAICPEEGFADAWIDLFLGACVRRATLEEEPIVRRGWQRHWLESRPLPPALKLRRGEADAQLRELLKE